ncbi:MAG: OmpA family protein [Segetibacter sp.]|nr:OmpA family protein [Segetibacter sp.]
MLKKLFFILFVCLSFNAFAQQETNIYFDFNKHELTPDAMLAINKIFFNKRVSTVSIYGHTDQLGTDEYNQQLSIKRATAVKDYMVLSGIDSARITIVKGLGETQPAINDLDSISRMANRRVTIVTVYEGAGAPTTSSASSPVTPPASRPQRMEKLIDEIKDPATKTGENIILKNINFYGGRHVFLPQAYPPLQELLEVMQKIPTLEIEIQGHICCQVGDVDGVDEETGEPVLSVNRAKAVYDYLVQKGIKKNRMSYKGFGHKYPIIQVERNEADATVNRRVEIKIIKK